MIGTSVYLESGNLVQVYSLMVIVMVPRLKKIRLEIAKKYDFNDYSYWNHTIWFTQKIFMNE